MLFKKPSFWIKKIILTAIRIYQILFSPDHGLLRSQSGTCRFRPTCSQYAWRAIDRFGILKGGLLSVKRILRCHPLNEGGWDPVK